MEKEKSEEILSEKVPLVVKYAKGNTSDEEAVRVRKSLKKYPQLRDDLHFIIKAIYGVYDFEICPSSLLLSYYHQNLEDLDKEIAEALEQHLETCDDCVQELEDFKEFHANIESVVASNLAEISKSKSKTITDILKELAEDYLNADIAEGLFKEIENIDVTSGEGAIEGGLALSGDASSELTSEEREFLGIVENVMPEKEEINDLLEKGNEEKVREKLLEILGDDQKVDQIIRLYKK